MVLKHQIVNLILIFIILQQFTVWSLKVHLTKDPLLYPMFKSSIEPKMTHDQTGQPVYDEQKYLVDLAQKQNAYKQKISEIQNNFAAINMMLNDSNLSQNEKSAKLAEALVGERNSLISAQTQLNLPYELKSCQCLNLGQQVKIELSQKLQKVNSKISDFEKSMIQQNANCKSHQCPLIHQLNEELRKMKNYQTIMKKTISSKCCEVVKYAYRDNLDSNNWHWGNTTQSIYQVEVFEKQQTGEARLQPCPFSQPWVLINQNACFSCPQDKPLFDLGRRTCEKDCAQASNNPSYVLNIANHACGDNTNCPSGQYFDQALKKCSITQTYINESSCPPAKPFWDSLSYSCQSCPSATPYFDVLLKTCRSCIQNQTWNEESRLCSSGHQCESGYLFDEQTKQCKRKTNDIHSLCPPEKPFWNQVTYSCDECGHDKPFYDSVRKICRVCNNQEELNQLTKQCISKNNKTVCAINQIYNPSNSQCEKKGTTSMCPPTTPYWDSINFKCAQCPAQIPFFNQESRQCLPCPLNTQWSSQEQQCIQSCSLDSQWNREYKKCLKINQSCPQKYAFSFDFNGCVEINCDEKNPFWNSSASRCQPCPEGTLYNYFNTVCEKDSRSGNASVCDENKPLWNPQYLRCQPCSQGKIWDVQLMNCVIPKNSNQSHLRYNHNLQKELKSTKVQKFEEGRVYGNEFYQYQYHDMSLLEN